MKVLCISASNIMNKGFPVANVVNNIDDIFPQQEYDWDKIKDIIVKYISKVIN